MATTTTKTTTKNANVAAAQAALLAKANKAPAATVAAAPVPVVAAAPVAPTFKGLQGTPVTQGTLAHGLGAHARYAKAANIAHATHVQVLVPNPKRPGTTAHQAFALYGAVGTVQDLATLRKAGVRNDHVTWDLARGFVAVLVAAHVQA